MFSDWFSSALLVHAAALTYVLGFMVRDQLLLRGLMQLGCVFYILYYYLEPVSPLWDAIIWTVIMFAANAWTILRILADRRTGTFDEEDLVIFSAIPHIAPGDFRRLMSKAEKATAGADVSLTAEGTTPENLWFVISGTATVEKLGVTRSVDAPIFVGEVAYLLNQNASATVTLSAGSRYASWNTADLRHLVGRSDGMRAALEAAFNRDLAAKVAAS